MRFIVYNLLPCCTRLTNKYIVTKSTTFVNEQIPNKSLALAELTLLIWSKVLKLTCTVRVYGHRLCLFLWPNNHKALLFP
jgi:hypothetical protein